MEHHHPDSLRARRRTLITGAAGQLGQALARAFAEDEVLALDRAAWDVCEEAPPLPWTPDLVLHAAALGAPLVAYSSDYVFDGSKRTPYLESDAPSPVSAYGRTKLHGEAAAGPEAWIVRSSWLFSETGHNFVRTMLRLGAERDEVAVVDDQRGCPTYVGHLAEASHALLEAGAPFGVWHLAAEGECTWAELAEAVFEEARLDCRVRRITSGEFGAPAPRPAYSVLRSEKGAPTLPHWRDGLRECLARLAGT